MHKSFIIAIGAGLASALLFATSARGAAPALLIAYVTPLPIMIAALGFGQATGLIAAGVASVCLAMTLGILPGVFFGVLLGFPSWWLAYLCLLARPIADTVPPSVPAASVPVLWYPIGRVVVWCAGLVALVVLTAGGVLLLRYGGFEPTVSLFATHLDSIVRTGRSGTGEGADPETARNIVQILPILLAASAFLMLVLNLWLGGRIVQRSALLSRPWPSLPEHLRLPKAAAGILVLACVLLLFEGPLRIAGGVVAASLGMAFALQGLGTAHALTRGLAARRAILFAIYFITVSVVPSLIALSVLGVVDCLVSLRQKPQAIPPSPTKA